MSEEPRRSVRATKGQHKALEQEQAIETPKRRGRKKKTQQEEKQEEPEEEVIRCVCGATEQDEDSGEPWIACDKCGAWQHNVCMGMSVYSEDLNLDYFCELCKPEDHKELLAGIARGEKPWEARRKAYEEEQEQEKKKKRGPKKGKGKRLSGDKDEGSQTPSKAKASPAPSAPEVKKETKEAKPAAGTKRKSRAGSQDESETPQKMRKVTETEAVPVPYNPPEDLAERITELLDARQAPAKALHKSLIHAIGAADKKGIPPAADGASVEARAERLAIQIERAVHDTHPNPKEYTSQVRTLAFNLKNNSELYARLASHSLTPPMLAAMTTDELASKEMQREKAEMKARADKQSILITDDGPRVRRTHKGEEMVGDDNFAIPSDETPSVIRRQSIRDSQAEPPKPQPEQHHEPSEEVELPAHIETTHVDTQVHSPKTDFDINKVFSSVKSPTTAHNRRPSVVTGPSAGPGIDPEVDRMLQDDGNESPPYSPTEETDPEVVWRGNVVMNSIANLYATAKHVGGANLSTTIGLPWNVLVPKRLPVAGRIDPQKAIEYLCSLRYSPLTDVVVVSLAPASEPAKNQFKILFDYFVSKRRYGVVGEKGLANVRDTYLVPVPPGTGGHPEFMLNLVDNFIPETRTEPMLLLVIVYRNSADSLEKLRQTNSSGQPVSQSPTAQTPTPAGLPHQRALSISAPTFSPTSPQGAFPSHPTPRGSQTPSQNQQHNPPGTAAQKPQGIGHSYRPADDAARITAQQQGEAMAREILGPLVNSPTVNFLLPQAYQMRQTEWEVIRRIFDRDPRARDDLQHLSILLEKEGRDSQTHSANGAGSGASAAAATPAPGPVSSAAPAPSPAAAAPTAPHRTPIPPPVIPPQAAAHATVRKQTPIPPPPIPPQATAAPPT